MNNDIISVLTKAKKTGEIVSLHLDPTNQSSCSVGYVDQITNCKVRLFSISPEGSCDGYEVRDISNIYRVDLGGKYEMKIEMLRTKYSEIYFDYTLDQIREGDDLLFATLNEAREKKLVVVVWTEDEDDTIIGFVDSVNHREIKILSLDDYGHDDGYIIITYDSITDIDCNSRKCQQLKFMYENAFPKDLAERNKQTLQSREI